jgi:hypothetical protein
MMIAPELLAAARLPDILELRRQGHGFPVIRRRLGFSRTAVGGRSVPTRARCRLLTSGGRPSYALARPAAGSSAP